MAVEVRQAGPEDAAAIAAVHVRAWQVAYRGLMPDEVLDRLSTTEREALWRQALAAAQEPAVFVAMADGSLVGFCSVATPSRDDDAGQRVAEIGAIYVEPEVWRAGVGRALMEAALAYLRAGDWEWVTLWVLAENEQGLAFYRGLGFERDGAEGTHERSGRKQVRLRARV